MPPDNLTISVVWGRLTAIGEEMATALVHTAYSDQVREGGDFTTAIFDRQGRLLAQANRSPAHLGAMPNVVRHMLEVYPLDRLGPGDVVALNDPYIGSGHLPDLFTMSPVVVDGAVLGFVVACVHLTDVGGSVPGSQAVVGVSNLMQEGLRLPPTLLYEAGSPNEAVFRLIEANVRVPELVLGDIRASRSALYVGASKVIELIELHGASEYEAAAEAFLDRSERAVREELDGIPDGTYAFAEHLDDVGEGTDPVRLAVSVTIDGSDIVFDFTGSDPQTASSLNSTLTYTKAYCYWATKAITTKDGIPQNEGQLRPVKVIAPPGSFFNPVPPAAVGGRAILNQRIVETIFGALAAAIPERVNAATGQWKNPIYGGKHPATGEDFIFYDFILSGVGARHGLDGIDSMLSVVSLQSVPVEIQEAQNPILVERFELMTDSGGAGRTRGGLSIRKDVRMLADDVTLSNLSDRYRFPPYGLDGGQPGTLGETVLNPDAREARPLHSKGIYQLKKGDLVSFRCSGSGGFGPPTERPRELVRADLDEGRISEGAAREIYGLEERE